MPVSMAQTTAVMDVINTILLTTGKGKRQLAKMFLELVDRNDWPQYYEVIPEPRCLTNIRNAVEKGRYKEALDIYTDLSLVFWNAMFYNEPTSQIVLDAKTLKAILETTWKKKSVLPVPRTSPPPSSPQKVHKVEEEEVSVEATPTPPISTHPAAPAPNTSTTPVTTAAPAVQTTLAPVASTSTTNFTYGKPVAIRPKSAQPPLDMDEDIITPDSDGHDNDEGAIDVDRDKESKEIVRQLEKGLPRWSGFGEEGWAETVSQDHIIEVVLAIKSYKNAIGNRLAVAVEAVSEEPTLPYLSYKSPISLKSIEGHARSKEYNNSKDFDMDMMRLFEKARRWHKPGTESYGFVLALQRLYQSLMSSNPPPGPPYHTNTNFAALRAGPGNVKPVHGGNGEGVPGVTTHRVLTKDRTFVDELHYKGWSLKLADWVHLSNPDDSSRPIIGQIFRCWVSDEVSRKDQPGLTVSWYYRPEQTYHAASRMFWEGEVFKTSHFADHPLEDVVEKIACQFTARHIRGRPRPPFWYLGFPLYVCDSRYNDRDRVFVKIKNWNSCVPEEVRKSTEFMPIYPFERTIFPRRLPSPFVKRGGLKDLAANKGPGGIIVIEVPDHPADPNQGDNVINGKRRTRRKGSGDPGSKGYGGGMSAQGINPSSPFSYQPSNLSQQLYPPRVNVPDRSVITAVGGVGALGQGAHIEKLPAETAKYFDRDPETNEVLWFPAPPVDVAKPSKPKYSLAYLHFLATKRRRDSDDVATGDDASVISPTKRSRLHVPPTVTETMNSVLNDLFVGL